MWNWLGYCYSGELGRCWVVYQSIAVSVWFLCMWWAWNPSDLSVDLLVSLESLGICGPEHCLGLGESGFRLRSGSGYFLGGCCCVVELFGDCVVG